MRFLHFHFENGVIKELQFVFALVDESFQYGRQCRLGQCETFQHHRVLLQFVSQLVGIDVDVDGCMSTSSAFGKCKLLI